MLSGFYLLIILSFLICLMSKDFYKILGIDRNASTKQIKSAYRKLSLKYHPDKNQGDKSAADKYIDIKEAYEALSDENNRQLYDAHGYDRFVEMKRQEAAGGGGPGFDDDIFDFFGHGRERTTQDIRLTVLVSLEDLYKGRQMTLTYERQVICDHCRGSGSEGGKVISCHVCKGKGYVMRREQVGGMFFAVNKPCPKCKGKGKIPERSCTVCGGSGLKTVKETVIIDIEPGMDQDDYIILEEKASESPGIKTGRAIFFISPEKDPLFTRNGDDLLYNLKISLKEALLGFEKSIVHLDGHEVPIKSNRVTRPNEKIKIRGEGMPRRGSNYSGDLVVKVVVIFPSTLTNKQRDSISEIF